MIIKDIDVNMHNVYEYVKLQIYLFDKNNIVKIKKEFYIVDNLVIKAFIDIDIMKSKDMIFDIKKNVMIIDLCKNIQKKISLLIIVFKSELRFSITIKRK